MSDLRGSASAAVWVESCRVYPDLSVRHRQRLLEARLETAMRAEVVAWDFLRLCSARHQALLDEAFSLPDAQFSMLMSIGAASLVERSAREACRSAVEATCLADSSAAWSAEVSRLPSKKLKYARAWRRIYMRTHRRTHGV